MNRELTLSALVLWCGRSLLGAESNKAGEVGAQGRSALHRA